MQRKDTAQFLVIVALMVTPVAGAEHEYGLGKLVPGRYLNAVRQGTTDTLPAIPSTPYDPAMEPSNGSVPNTISQNANSAPVAKTVASPASSAVRSVAESPAPTSVPSRSGAVWVATEPQPKAQAASGSDSSFASYHASIGEGGPDSVPAFAPATPPKPAMKAAPGQVGFLAGSVGDPRGVTGLGAGWMPNGARQANALPKEYASDTARNLAGAPGVPAREGSPREGAANRLLASVQQDASRGDSATQVAQQIDSNLQSDGYRALNSVLAFQEMPRGAADNDPRPKQLWLNPDPKRIKSTPEALNHQHAKEPLGQAAAAYRRSSAGSADGSVPGLVTSSRGGDAGGMGQTSGIYQSGSGAPSSANAAPSPVAAPFQFPFPMPASGGDSN